MLKKCLRAWVGSGEGTHIFSLLNLVKNLHNGIICYLQEPLWYSSLGKIMNYSNICKFNKNRFLSNLTTVYYTVIWTNIMKSSPKLAEAKLSWYFGNCTKFQEILCYVPAVMLDPHQKPAFCVCFCIRIRTKPNELG